MTKPFEFLFVDPSAPREHLPRRSDPIFWFAADPATNLWSKPTARAWRRDGWREMSRETFAGTQTFLEREKPGRPGTVERRYTSHPVARERGGGPGSQLVRLRHELVRSAAGSPGR